MNRVINEVVLDYLIIGATQDRAFQGLFLIKIGEAIIRKLSNNKLKIETLGTGTILLTP